MKGEVLKWGGTKTWKRCKCRRFSSLVRFFFFYSSHAFPPLFLSHLPSVHPGIPQFICRSACKDKTVVRYQQKIRVDLFKRLSCVTSWSQFQQVFHFLHPAHLAEMTFVWCAEVSGKDGGFSCDYATFRCWQKGITFMNFCTLNTVDAWL